MGGYKELAMGVVNAIFFMYACFYSSVDSRSRAHAQASYSPGLPEQRDELWDSGQQTRCLQDTRRATGEGKVTGGTQNRSQFM